MGKIILLGIIIGLIYYVIKFAKKSNDESNSELIRCDICNTFYPKNEIKRVKSKNICKECYANS